MIIIMIKLSIIMSIIVYLKFKKKWVNKCISRLILIWLFFIYLIIMLKFIFRLFYNNWCFFFMFWIFLRVVDIDVEYIIKRSCVYLFVICGWGGGYFCFFGIRLKIWFCWFIFKCIVLCFKWSVVLC